MTQQKPNMPRNRKGLAHIIDAAQFSAGGFARLWRETAFRLEMLAGALCLIGLVWLGATLFQLVAFGVLALVLLAVEALNTAIEEIDSIADASDLSSNDPEDWPWGHLIHIADTRTLEAGVVRYFDHPVIKVLVTYQELTWAEVYAQGHEEWLTKQAKILKAQ